MKKEKNTQNLSIKKERIESIKPHPTTSKSLVSEKNELKAQRVHRMKHMMNQRLNVLWN